MTKNEFIALIGQDVVVDYPFGRELQRWSMKNFYIDGNGEVKSSHAYYGCFYCQRKISPQREAHAWLRRR